MPKYDQDTKDKAVALAKAGVPLKEIQRQVGPNPKATQRYLVKVGIKYADLREELKKAGKLQPNQKKNAAVKGNKKTENKPTVEVTEE